MNLISVDVETNDKLKKAELENGFYNGRPDKYGRSWTSAPHYRV